MRKEEQFSLEWPKVSFERNRIYLNKTKNGSDREIPMSKSRKEAWLTLRKQRAGDGRIFYSKFGEPLNDPRTWFELAIAEAKIANFTWHDLRHTFSSSLIMSGVDLKTAKTLMGHKTNQDDRPLRALVECTSRRRSR
jgi:integrase